MTHRMAYVAGAIASRSSDVGDIDGNLTVLAVLIFVADLLLGVVGVVIGLLISAVSSYGDPMSNVGRDIMLASMVFGGSGVALQGARLLAFTRGKNLYRTIASGPPSIPTGWIWQALLVPGDGDLLIQFAFAVVVAVIAYS